MECVKEQFLLSIFKKNSSLFILPKILSTFAFIQINKWQKRIVSVRNKESRRQWSEE